VIPAAPLDPTADEARERLLRELSEARYREARPTWFDDLVSRLLDRIGDLFDGGMPGVPSLGWLLATVVVVGLAVAAYVVYGPPRLARRSSGARPVFGADDARDAATIRRAAEAASAAGDWALAVEEGFRAIVRGLSERTVLAAHPGTTASGIAAAATRSFPGLGSRLARAAALFDDVRYLGGAGSEAAYREMAALDGDLRTSTPLLDPAAAP
jgi:hypothetical protein